MTIKRLKHGEDDGIEEVQIVFDGGTRTNERRAADLPLRRGETHRKCLLVLRAKRNSEISESDSSKKRRKVERNQRHASLVPERCPTHLSPSNERCAADLPL